jgi:oligopeptide transport system substrate-binding protein
MTIALFRITYLALLAGSVMASETVLNRGVFGEPESLDPDRSGVISEVAITADLFTGLTTFDAAGRVSPGMAESWAVSADGLKWTFHLRNGTRWSDGTSLTAADFEFSLRRSLTPETATTNAARLYPILNARAVLEGTLPPDAIGVTAPDESTLLVELEHPFPGLPLTLAGPEGYPVPRHKVLSDTPWTVPGSMVSNGPFVLAGRRSHDFVRLERNRYFYAADDVALDAVVYLPADNVDVQVNRFRAGEIHINGWPGFNPRRQDWLKTQVGASVRVTPILIVSYLRFNTTRKPFDDPRVRRALTLAVDRRAIAEKVLGAGEKPSWNVTPPGISGYEQAQSQDADLEIAERLSLARRLLTEAGIENLALEIRHPSGSGKEPTLAVAQMWKAIGVEATLHRSEIKSMIADLRRGDFDLAYTGALDGDNPERFLERFHSTSSYNTGQYDSARFDGALASARRLANPQDRARALRDAEAILLQDVPVVVLFSGVARNLVAPEVRGWIDNPQDIHPSRYLNITTPVSTTGR